MKNFTINPCQISCDEKNSRKWNFVLMLLFVFSISNVDAQYCGAATSNVAITPIATSQNTLVYNSGRRAFNFAATAGCTYTFATCGLSSADTYLRLYSTGTGGTALVSADDNCGLQSSFTWTCVTSGTYSVLLTRYPCNTLTSSARMSYRLVSCAPAAAPANDLVCNAITIACGSTTAGTTVNATSTGTYEGTNFCGPAQSSAGVWYNFIGTGQTITASLCSSGWDSKIQIYSGATCTTLSCIGGVDDNGPACGGASASYTWASAVGVTYWINVSGYSTTSAFSLQLTCVTPIPAPANNDCANAQSISIQCPASATVVSGTTANATEEAGIADPTCDPGTIRDVWYTFNSGLNTSVNLSVTLGTASWLGGEVHSSCGSPAPGLTIGGNAGNCDFYLLNPAPTVISGLVPNTTYRLRLFNNVDWDVAGSFTFTLTNSINNPGAISVPSSVCVGTLTTISNITAATGAPNAANYYFYYRGGPSNIAWTMYDGPSANTSSVLPGAVINTPGTWFVARNSDFGCGQANNTTTIDLQIIVTPGSTAPTLTGTSPVCPATSVTINAGSGTASPGSAIYWYNGPNGTGNLLGTGTSYVVSPAATTTYYARREGGCNTTADGSYTITVNNPTLATTPSTGDMVWKGASSTDWATLPNWWQYNGSAYIAASAAPTATQNVIIPANQTCIVFQPNTNTNAGNAKNLTIEIGATLIMGNGIISVAENWLNNGTFTPGTATVAFTGTGTHTISGSSTIHTFNNLTINKSGEVQLNVPITMSGTLNLTDGRLNIGNFNLDLPTNTINGGNASSFVHTSGTGTLNRNVAGSAINFPVGRTAYNPATLTNSGTSDKFSVRVINNVTDDGTAIGTTTSMAVVNRTWMINEQTTGESNVTLRLQWNDVPEHINGFQPIDAFIAHYMSGAGLWDNIGGTIPSVNSIETAGITSFSPFTISSSPMFAPLPVELISFQANCQGEGKVEITWATASEHNSDKFTVEKSRDGIIWSVLASLAGAGNSTQLINYALVDNVVSGGNNYYRLVQTDIDGATETFNIASANCGKDTETSMSVYPNPSSGDFYVNFNTEELSVAGVIQITDAKGSEVHSQEVTIEKGSNVFHVNMEAAPGIYYIRVYNGTSTSSIVKHSLR